VEPSGLGEAVALSTAKVDLDVAIVRLHAQVDRARVFVDVERRMMLAAGEEPATGQGGESRVGISPRDIDALASGAGIVGPADGDSVGGVIAF
jgi:hypothetical protein